MNKWQMDGGTLGAFNGGSALDQHGKKHYSIHPYGKRRHNKRVDKNRAAA